MAKQNPALKREDARRQEGSLVPENYIFRVIQFAKPGLYRHRIPGLRHRLGFSEAYLTVSGQNSNNSVSRHATTFLRAVEARQMTGSSRRASPARSPRRSRRATCGNPGGLCRLGLGGSRSSSTTPPSTSGTPARRSRSDQCASNPCSEYMFLDDTACNLASVNLLPYQAIRRLAPSTRPPMSTPCACGPIVLEISVMMAQFPSQAPLPSARIEYRTLGIGYANIGGFLMTSGIPYDSKPKAAPSAGAAHGHHDRRLLCHLGRNGHPNWAPSRMYKRERASTVLRVIRNHAATPPTAKCGGLREASPSIRCRSIHGHCPDQDAALSDARQGRLGQCPMPSARSMATATRRFPWYRPDRHHRLVMDCDTTGIEPDFALVKFKKARRWRLFQDHQPGRAGGPVARWAMTKARSPRSNAYAVGHGNLNQAPGVNPSDRCAAKGFTATTRSRRSTVRPGHSLRHQVRLQPVDAGGADFLAPALWRHRRRAADMPRISALTC